MSLSVGSGLSSALSGLQQMLQSGSTNSSKSQSFDPLAALLQSGSTSSSSSSSATSSSGASSSCSPFAQGMMAQLLSLQQQQSDAGVAGEQGSAKLFAKLDTDGSGGVSKSEFQTATSAHGIDTSISDAVFDKIDADGDGTVTQAELAKVDRPGGGNDGQDVGTSADAGGSGNSGGDGEGTKTTTTVNADGSVTTTITYADGSSASTTSPPPAEANSSDGKAKDGPSGNGGSDLFRQLAELQKQLVTTATSTLSAVA